VQADIAEYVNYVTPVKGVQQIIAKRNPALANNQLIFPSQNYTKNCSTEPALAGKLGEEVNEAFQALLVG
jgi:spermidine/putrescine transport system substrate-binding protein